MNFYDGKRWTHNDVSLYVRSMGKRLEVTAAIIGDDNANAYMSTHDGQAVVAVVGSLVLLAGVNDRGE